ALDLAQLVHQADLVLQATGSIDHDNVDFLLDASGNSFKGNRSRISAVDLGTHGRHAHTVAPSGKLLGGSSAEGICCTEQYILVFCDQNTGHLADGCGLAYPIDADNHDDAWAVRVRS